MQGPFGNFRAPRTGATIVDGKMGNGIPAMSLAYETVIGLTGQNGLSDYDEGFTNFLWTFGRSGKARQESRQAAF